MNIDEIKGMLGKKVMYNGIAVTINSYEPVVVPVISARTKKPTKKTQETLNVKLKVEQELSINLTDDELEKFKYLGYRMVKDDKGIRIEMIPVDSQKEASSIKVK